MKKIGLGILAGAAVLFVWGAVSWMFLPWHNGTIKRLPEEQLITDTLKTVIKEPGFYSFPGHEGPDGKKDDGAWAEKYRRGPIGSVVFQPAGAEPMAPSNFLCEIVGNLAAAAVTMLILYLSRDRVKGIVPRALLVTAVGLVVGVSAHMTYWNWFRFPGDFTAVNVLDGLMGFLLMGLTQAKFVPEA